LCAGLIFLVKGVVIVRRCRIGLEINIHSPRATMH